MASLYSTQMVNTAAHSASASAHAVGHAAGYVAGGLYNGFRHPIQAAKTSKTYVSDKVHNGKARIQQWRHGNQQHPVADGGMGSAIDICECSRRVQGHLAIQYPEFH